VNGKKAPRLQVTEHGNLDVEAIAQSAGDVTPADWANVTTTFKAKDMARRLKAAENRAKGKGGRKRKNKKVKAKAKAKAKAPAVAKAKATAVKRAKKSKDDLVPWATILKRQHSNIWHKETLRGIKDLELSKEDAQEAAGVTARAHVAKLRKMLADGDFKSMPSFGCKVDFGDLS
jgi:hypothetical protein